MPPTRNRDPTGQTPWTDPPGQRHPCGQKPPLDRDPLWTETPWTEFPSGQTNSCENLTFANFVCGRKKRNKYHNLSLAIVQCEPTSRRKRLCQISQIMSRLSQIIKCHIHWVLLTTSSVRTNTPMKTSRFLCSKIIDMAAHGNRNSHLRE